MIINKAKFCDEFYKEYFNLISPYLRAKLSLYDIKSMIDAFFIVLNKQQGASDE